MTQPVTARFELGQIVITPGALTALQLAGHAPGPLLDRHARGDWGTVGAEDCQANEEALKDGSRILSAYTVDERTKVWVITEAVGEGGKRESICVLLPGEY